MCPTFPNNKNKITVNTIERSQNPGQQFTLVMPMLSEIYLPHHKMEKNYKIVKEV